MKESVYRFALLFFVLLMMLSGCVSYEKDQLSVTENPTIEQETVTQEPEEEVPTQTSKKPLYACVADTTAFWSLEEFDQMIKQAVSSNASSAEDPLDLAALERYYLPTAIPENYQLYKIVVSTVDIGFWYLPEKYIATDTTDVGETESKHYLFACGRTHDFDAIAADQKIQPKVSASGNFRYFVSDGQILWEKDDTTFFLYTPEGTNLSKNDLEILCGVEAHIAGTAAVK